MRSVEHNVCSAGVSRWSAGLFARLSGAASDINVSDRVLEQCEKGKQTRFATRGSGSTLSGYCARLRRHFALVALPTLRVSDAPARIWSYRLSAANCTQTIRGVMIPRDVRFGLSLVQNKEGYFHDEGSTYSLVNVVLPSLNVCSGRQAQSAVLLQLRNPFSQNGFIFSGCRMLSQMIDLIWRTETHKRYLRRRPRSLLLFATVQMIVIGEQCLSPLLAVSCPQLASTKMRCIRFGWAVKLPNRIRPFCTPVNLYQT